MAVLKGLIVILTLAALGVMAAGGWRLHQDDTGAKAVATVSECHHVSGLHGGSTVCTGSWVQGGSLLGRGHVVLGTINGVGRSDVGNDVAVRIHGGSAYARSRTAVIVLFCVGVGLLLVAGWFTWAVRTGRADGSRARAAAAAGSATATSIQ